MSTPERTSPFRRHWLAATGLLTAAACATAPVAFKDSPLEGPPIEVATQEGVVRGVTEGDVHVFLGVPYGAPVAGADRWIPPKPAAKRAAAFDASKFGPSCEQTVGIIPRWMLTEAGEVTLYESTDIQGFADQEKGPDCLRANIWTPRLPDPEAVSAAGAPTPQEPAPAVAEPPPTPTPTPTLPADGGVPAAAADAGAASVVDGDAGPAAAAVAAEAVAKPAPPAEPAMPAGLPVIVKLHGGGLGMGSAQHPALEGDILARKGVVVVTINFRLGPIGFLAADGVFEGDVLTGSRGMMDIVLALEWVRDNIARFGGDPANVTLMGQSGGGTAVWSVIASPRSEGLVRRAIVMSGPIYDFPIEEQKKLAGTVLEQWGVPPGDADALAKVGTEDATSTIMLTTAVGKGEEYGSMGRIAPNNGAATGTPFMPDSVFEAIEKGRFNGIDLLVGNCDDDWAVSTLAVPLPNSIALDIWNGFIKGMVADTDEGYQEMVDKYVAAQPEVSPTRAKGVFQTDALYRIRALKAAARHSELTQDDALGKTYAYQFRLKSPAYPEGIGAMHGLDLTFAFGNIHKVPRMLGHEDGKIDPKLQELSDGMVDMLASFAATGTPSSEKLPEWPEYETGKRQTMVFDEKTEVVSDPQGKLRKLWD